MFERIKYDIAEHLEKLSQIRDKRLKTEEKFLYQSPFVDHEDILWHCFYYSELIFYINKDTSITARIEALKEFEILRNEVIVEHYNEFHRIYVVKKIDNELKLINTLNYTEKTEDVETYLIKLVNFRCL